MLQLGDTDAVEDRWSKEKAWTLGGDLPEEGARHIAREAWDKHSEEEVAVRPDWANSTAMIHRHETLTMQFATPLLLPGFDDVEAKRRCSWPISACEAHRPHNGSTLNIYSGNLPPSLTSGKTIAWRKCWSGRALARFDLRYQSQNGEYRRLLT